jgi:hypothetical protein
MACPSAPNPSPIRLEGPGRGGASARVFLLCAHERGGLVEGPPRVSRCPWTLMKPCPRRTAGHLSRKDRASRCPTRKFPPQTCRRVVQLGKADPRVTPSHPLMGLAMTDSLVRAFLLASSAIVVSDLALPPLDLSGGGLSTHMSGTRTIAQERAVSFQPPPNFCQTDLVSVSREGEVANMKPIQCRRATPRRSVEII